MAQVMVQGVQLALGEDEGPAGGVGAVSGLVAGRPARGVVLAGDAARRGRGPGDAASEAGLVLARRRALRRAVAAVRGRRRLPRRGDGGHCTSMTSHAAAAATTAEEDDEAAIYGGMWLGKGLTGGEKLKVLG